MVKKAVYAVNVAGQDISSRLLPLLTSIRVTDKEGTHSDTADITIDDAGGLIRFPKDGDPMTVSLGWEGELMAVVFEGTIDQAKSSGSRGGGRELQISAKGVDTKGKAKQGQQLNIDNATVKDAMNKAGKAAGITVEVDAELAKIKREWWGLNDESFLNFGERVARELGGIFKIKGNKAILAKKGGKTVSGAAMLPLVAAWGLNLISWDITPFTGRPRNKKVRARYFDRKASKWQSITADVQDDGASSTLADRYSRTDEGEAKGSTESGARESEKQKGGGTIEIDGTAAAKPGGTVAIVGARPGVDGSYRIESVTHNYTRSGWLTNCELKQPQGDAGKDTRK